MGTTEVAKAAFLSPSERKFLILFVFIESKLMILFFKEKLINIIILEFLEVCWGFMGPPTFSRSGGRGERLGRTELLTS